MSHGYETWPPVARPRAPALTIDVGWVTAGQLARIVAIERLGRDDAWDRLWVRAAAAWGVVLMALDERGEALGYAIFERHPSRLHLIRLTVDPAERCRGVGTALIDHLKTRLGDGAREAITTTAGEVNYYAGPCWLHRQGFVATGLTRRPGDPAGDGIDMVYRHEWEHDL
jgi:ribosomal protein S18 acetylase RimI-like enzyme